MFNFFNTASDYKEAAKDYQTTPLVDSVPISNKNGYTVGMDDDNNTVLKLNVGNAVTTMTLSPTGTRQLIRMLKATLPEEDDWK